MKEIGYRTACCNKLKTNDEAHGVLYKPDIFNTLESFKTVKPEKSDIHYCTECYAEKVTDTANMLVYRKNNEEKYRDTLKELSYIFMKTLFKLKDLA